jgi:hypothetical protein
VAIKYGDLGKRKRERSRINEKECKEAKRMI